MLRWCRYLYTPYTLPYISGGNFKGYPYIITGDASSAEPNSDPTSDPANPLTCSLPPGRYSAQVTP